MKLRPNMELFQCGICQIKFGVVCDFFEHFQEHRDLLYHSHMDVSSTTEIPNGFSANNPFSSTQTSNCVENNEIESTDAGIHDLIHMCNKPGGGDKEVIVNKDNESFHNSTQASVVVCAACKGKFPTICAFEAHLNHKSFYFCESTMTCIPKTLDCILSSNSDFFISVEIHTRNECEEGMAVSDADAISVLDKYNSLTENQESMEIVKVERPCNEDSSSASDRTYATDKNEYEKEVINRHRSAKTSKTYSGDTLNVNKISNINGKHKPSADTNSVTQTCQESTNSIDVSVSRQQISHFKSKTCDNKKSKFTEITNQLPPSKGIRKKRGRPPKSSVQKADALTCSNGILETEAIDVKQSEQQVNEDNLNDMFSQDDGNRMETFEGRNTDNAEVETYSKRKCGRPRKPDNELKYPRKNTFGIRIRGRPKKPDSELKYRRKVKPCSVGKISGK